MKQSLFEDAAADEHSPFIAALQAAESRWRFLALAALATAGVALIAAVVAITVAFVQ
jgi:hypothetical protein